MSAMPKLGRRAFLVGSALLGGAGLVAGYGLFFNTPERYVARVVTRRLDYINFAPGAVEAFAADLVKSELRLTEPKGRIVSLLGTRLSQWILDNVLKSPPENLDAFEESVAGQFLLSSTFFTNMQDQKAPVEYIALADPYSNACFNPFAVVD
jgi:hypothetical protein